MYDKALDSSEETISFDDDLIDIDALLGDDDTDAFMTIWDLISAYCFAYAFWYFVNGIIVWFNVGLGHVLRICIGTVPSLYIICC